MRKSERWLITRFVMQIHKLPQSDTITQVVTGDKGMFMSWLGNKILEDAVEGNPLGKKKKVHFEKPVKLREKTTRTANAWTQRETSTFVAPCIVILGWINPTVLTTFTR